jgi:hypothetical protein
LWRQQTERITAFPTSAAGYAGVHMVNCRTRLVVAVTGIVLAAQATASK